MARRKIPTGSGSYFVVSENTRRFPIEAPGGRLVAELLVNTAGNGAIVLVPPRCKLPDGVDAVRTTPTDAVELLRRGNLQRLADGRAELAIPAALIRRAKAETLPGIEALVPFPGKAKQFFDGRGSWADTGLWLSADGEWSLEMRAAVGWLRKVLSQAEAEQWLRANSHEIPTRTSKPTGEPADAWRVATAGHPAAGSRAWQSVSWGTGEPLGADAKAEIQARRIAAISAVAAASLRAQIRKTKALSPPAISAPGKPRRPRRRR